MKKLLIIFAICMLHQTGLLAWGKTGHRIVGQIAENHLTKKARKNLKVILGTESLAMVSNYMDFIKADDAYNHMNPWHYCTIPDGMTYAEAGTPEAGDIIQTIERLLVELKTKNFTDKDEAFALKCLVHLVGDIHQPLHVGNGTDKGGNDVGVKFFSDQANLHSVWDSKMIDHQQLSYTEYAAAIDHFPNSRIDQLQQASVLEWAEESKLLRPLVYDLPDNERIAWEYIYKTRAVYEQRLAEAGIRLAGLLNRIYG